ncbi:GNAT family N-acetyltransferase [Corallincola spongiicola]|uniref:GNAT family N-acetyltransferase n=1 Tax=Corallincola spongiicola TaxID=2520508 RepID=A0ABY1WPD3_9GAMM|nr:GNAT family N-acetyltransferase [Corallincola spongiicola]TAA45941.1 GNAT family N-acetyltransferase [Corallincola spongiicola]
MLNKPDSSLRVVIADYRDPTQGEALLQLLNEYAMDPMGGGTPITAHTRANLLHSLANEPQAVTFLAELDGKYVGLANCFFGFSTFACAKLINIHDFAVSPGLRGQGIGQALMAAVENHAREHGCCKVTLEVLEGNKVAQRLYQRCGFAGYALDPEAGQAMFWDKKLN